MTAARKAKHAVGMAGALVLLAGTLAVFATAALIIHTGLAAAGAVASAPIKRKGKR